MAEPCNHNLMADGYCHIQNDVELCSYDGGDCCMDVMQQMCSGISVHDFYADRLRVCHALLPDYCQSK